MPPDAVVLTSRTRPSTVAGAQREDTMATIEKAARARPVATRCVDVHHHFYPPEYLAAMDGYQGRGLAGATFPGLRQWTVARSVEEMDRHGVETAILSLSPPGVRMGEGEARRALARRCNEFAAQMARDHRGRYGLFAAMPMPDVDGTLKEIDYALDVLKADGIGLMTSYGDKWPGDPAFEPVFAELNRRKAICYIHPFAPDCCASMIDWVPAPLIEYPHDTTRAVLSLLFSGTLSRMPDIRFVFCHAGGTVPMLAGRVGHSGSNRPFLSRVPKGIDYELKKLHYDIAIAAYRPSLLALLDYVPLTQILFGSDYPFSGIGHTMDGLAGMELAEAAVRAIHRGNAERLMPRLRG
jgi:predicted TIM-barrel fold metal-dependent hydrolase